MHLKVSEALIKIVYVVNMVHEIWLSKTYFLQVYKKQASIPGSLLWPMKFQDANLYNIRKC